MATAKVNARKVYQACHKAIKTIAHRSKDKQEEDMLREKIGKLADLSYFIDSSSDGDGLITLTEEDYALINGYIE